MLALVPVHKLWVPNECEARKCMTLNHGPVCVQDVKLSVDQLRHSTCLSAQCGHCIRRVQGCHIAQCRHGVTRRQQKHLCCRVSGAASHPVTSRSHLSSPAQHNKTSFSGHPINGCACIVADNHCQGVWFAPQGALQAAVRQVVNPQV